MSESKFNDDEIERLRRAQVRKSTNVDPDKLQAQRDFLTAARTDTLEEFQARLMRRGLNKGTERWDRAIAAYWAIRRER